VTSYPLDESPPSTRKQKATEALKQRQINADAYNILWSHSTHANQERSTCVSTDLESAVWHLQHSSMKTSLSTDGSLEIIVSLSKESNFRNQKLIG
jgi:hypothetical protein